MKDKNISKIKFKKRILFIGLFLILLIVITIVNKKIAFDKREYIYFTQLCNNSESQMMGYFIRTSNGKNIVIDGGTIEDSLNLQKYINENGGKVDYWFLTHFHLDHTGAIADIIENTSIPIEKIIYKSISRKMVEDYEDYRINQYDVIHNALENERIKDSLVNISKAQEFEISSNIKIKAISVFENVTSNNFGNNTSTVFKIQVNDKSILILGDIGEERSKQLLENNKDELKSDYVQMAHHGQNGATFELYKEIKPKYCFWPTPKWLWNNDLGEGFNTASFKTIQVRNWMKELNVQENYVEKDGDITIIIGK